MRAHMQQPELCIVLRRVQGHTHTIVIFSKQHGKITAVVRLTDRFVQLRPGTLIACTLTDFKTSCFVAHNVQIIIYPIVSSSEKLWLLHHLLEVSYYFLAEHNVQPEVFSFLYCCLIMFMHDAILLHDFALVCKLCVLKLLMLLGVHPEKNLAVLSSLFDKIIEVSVDLPDPLAVKSVLQELAYLSTERENALSKWIAHSFEQHPYRSLFKTVGKKN